jgi:hypothetical protein
VARRQRLSEIQVSELFDPPTEQRELVRYYTLSEADLAAIVRCRGDHNRLASPSCVAICAIPAGLCRAANGRLRP